MDYGPHIEKIRQYRRAQAREDLLSFAALMAPHEKPAKHHRVMARFMMALIEGRFRKLMILMPPRAGKSLYCKYFMSWILGYLPKTTIVHVTHTGPLAEDVGYETRGLISRDEYPFDMQVKSDKAARLDWGTSNGGKYFGSSMAGGPTGRPANLLVVDDPLTNAADADSEVIRNRQWSEYERSLRSRMQPWSDGRPPIELMVLTRWNEDDLAGRHLPLDYDGRPGRFESRITGEEWVVCSMPARAEHDNDLLKRERGAWLWPERFGDDSAWAMAERMGGRTWGSLYQQRPSPEHGVIIQRDWLRFYAEPPPLERLQIYGASDYAVTAAGRDTRDPDYTVHMIFGVDPSFNIYLLDMWRGRTQSHVWIDELMRLVRQWNPLIWGEERGQILSSVGPFIDRRLLDNNLFIARRQYASRQSKGVRAGEMQAMNSQSLVGLLAQGKVYLPKVAPWPASFGTIEELVAEMLAFPAGRHDDMVDTMSLFARMIGEIIAGSRPARIEEVTHPESMAHMLAVHDAMQQEAGL